MTVSYIEQIDAQLAALRMEIHKLEIAREVIANLDTRAPKTITLKAEPAPKKSSPITIRKIGSSGGAAPRTMTSKGLDKRAAAALMVHKEGLGLKELGAAIDLPQGDKKAANRLWYAMDIAIKKGKFVKDGSLYKLPTAAPEPVTEEPETDAA